MAITAIQIVRIFWILDVFHPKKMSVLYRNHAEPKKNFYYGDIFWQLGMHTEQEADRTIRRISISIVLKMKTGSLIRTENERFLIHSASM